MRLATGIAAERLAECRDRWGTLGRLLATRSRRWPILGRLPLDFGGCQFPYQRIPLPCKFGQ